MEWFLHDKGLHHERVKNKNWRQSLRQRYFLETINLDVSLELINAISVPQVVFFFFQFFILEN